MKKVELIIVGQSGKSVKILITLKKDLFGVLDRGERGDDNRTSLKEGGSI